MAEKGEREWRKKKERERKVERGKVSFYVCVRVGGHLSWSSEGSSEGVQKRDVNGENFRLAGKS